MTDPARLPERPENFADAIDRITPEICAALRTAIETGRWPDGRVLTQEQRAQSLQAVIAWEAVNLEPERRTGYIADQCRSTAAGQDVSMIASDRQQGRE